MTLRLKIQLVAVVIAIASMAAMAWIGYRIARHALLASLEERVESIAATAAIAVDPTDLAQLTSRESAGTPAYARVLAVARAATEAGKSGLFPVRWVYMLTPTTHQSGSGWDLAIDTDPQSAPDRVPPGTPYAAKIASTGEPAEIPAQWGSRYLTDEWGEWLSGFAPVRDEHGVVVGLVGADIDYKVVTDVLVTGSGSVILGVGLLSLLVYLAAGLSITRLMRPVDRISVHIARLGAGEFAQRIALPASEELRILGDDLNSLAQHLAEREHLSSQNRALSADVARKGEQLDAIARVDVQLHEIQDVDILIERILANARMLLRCDAGSVMLREGDALLLAWVQNDTLSRGLPAGQRLRVPVSRIPIGGGSIAGYVASSGLPVVIDDAYTIPQGAPYHFNQAVDEATGYRTRALLTLPLRTSSGRVIGVLQLLNPVDGRGGARAGFTPDDLDAIHHFATAATVALERASLTRSIVMRMVQMAELRDPSETASHVQRVAAYSVILYEAWAVRHGIDPSRAEGQRDTLRIAAMLHDVGKVGIPDSILKKPGRLTVEEYRTIQEHVRIGAALFAEGDTPIEAAAREVALHHHERWDGAGYPGTAPSSDSAAGGAGSGYRSTPMSGEQIPLFARIVGVADVFDALSSKRQYKEAWPEERVVAEMKVNAGRQFDPELIDILVERLADFRMVAARYP